MFEAIASIYSEIYADGFLVLSIIVLQFHIGAFPSCCPPELHNSGVKILGMPCPLLQPLSCGVSLGRAGKHHLACTL